MAKGIDATQRTDLYAAKPMEIANGLPPRLPPEIIPSTNPAERLRTIQTRDKNEDPFSPTASMQQDITDALEAQGISSDTFSQGYTAPWDGTTITQTTNSQGHLITITQRPDGSKRAERNVSGKHYVDEFEDDKLRRRIGPSSTAGQSIETIYDDGRTVAVKTLNCDGEVLKARYAAVLHGFSIMKVVEGSNISYSTEQGQAASFKKETITQADGTKIPGIVMSANGQPFEFLSQDQKTRLIQNEANQWVAPAAK